MDTVTTRFDNHSFATDSDESGEITRLEALAIENDIESWHTHSLQEPDEFSPPQESIPGTPNTELPDILCYGMVCPFGAELLDI